MKFPAYPEYQNLDFSWPPQIPSHWGVKWLKYAAPAVNEKTEEPSPDLRYIGLENMESWSGRLLDGEDYSPESTSNLFEAGDILFGKLRPYLAKVYQAPGKGVCSSECFVLRPGSVKSDFLKYYLLTQEFVGLVNSSTFGAKMPRASWEFMGHLPQVIPPEEEQQKIAQFLDYQTAKIDRLIEKQQRLIGLLDEKRQAAISSAITKDLGQEVPVKDSGIDWAGDVPEHWEVGRVGWWFKVQLGKMLDERRIAGDQLYPYLRNVDIQWDRINTEDLPEMDFSPLERAIYELRNGDLLVCEGGEIGKAAIWPYDGKKIYFQKALHRVRPRRKGQSEYLLWVLRLLSERGFLGGSSTTSTIHHLTVDKFKHLRMPLPPPSEQEKISRFIRGVHQEYLRLEDKAEQGILLLKERRQALISAAVTGQIDVRGWSPPEPEPEEPEPAEALHG